MKKSASELVSIDEKWRTEADVRTLAEAAAIKADAKRLARARAMAKEKLMEMAAVANAEPNTTKC